MYWLHSFVSLFLCHTILAILVHSAALCSVWHWMFGGSIKYVDVLTTQPHAFVFSSVFGAGRQTVWSKSSCCWPTFQWLNMFTNTSHRWQCCVATPLPPPPIMNRLSRLHSPRLVLAEWLWLISLTEEGCLRVWFAQPKSVIWEQWEQYLGLWWAMELSFLDRTFPDVKVTGRALLENQYVNSLDVYTLHC